MVAKGRLLEVPLFTSWAKAETSDCATCQETCKDSWGCEVRGIDFKEEPCLILRGFSMGSVD